MERRITPYSHVEVRDGEKEGIAGTLVGYAAVYYRDGDEATEYRLRPGVVERIEHGAFNRVLEERQDVLALFDHDTSKLLGRVSSGTLRLAGDDVGLRYEIDLPDTSAGRDVAESVRRGDINGSSFGFRDAKSQMQWGRGGGASVRSISSFGTIRDIGPVTQPAYTGTTAGLRSADDDGSFEEELKASEAEASRNPEGKARVADWIDKQIDSESAKA